MCGRFRWQSKFDQIEIINQIMVSECGVEPES